ncbi:adenosine kinase [Nematocida sp. AWRm77]|nr:adenosine kinase [Nematocida sp. AWRm77]
MASFQMLKKCLSIYPPMLDIVCHTSAELLKKYRVPINSIVGYSEKKHKELHRQMQERLEKKDPDISLKIGGATFNTQRLLSKWVECQFFGIIGTDTFGSIAEMEIDRKKEKIAVHLDKIKGNNTPWGYVFLSGEERTMVASQNFDIKYPSETVQKIMDSIDESTLFYIVSFSFPLKNIGKLVFDILDMKKEKKFTSVINLSSEEIASDWKDQILKSAEKCDFMIGNRAEYYRLCNTTDEKAMIEQLDALKVGYAITDGAGSVIGKIPGGLLRKITPHELPKGINTNGAGDAFVAGFIKEMVKDNWRTDLDIYGLLESGVSVAQEFISAQSSSSSPLQCLP